MKITTIRLRADRWRDHDASVPYLDIARVLRNGTNPAGRRPHTLDEPQLRLPANDNHKAAKAA